MHYFFRKMHYLFALIFSGLLGQFFLRSSFSKFIFIYLHSKYSDINKYNYYKKVGLGK